MGFYEDGKRVLNQLDEYYNQSIHKKRPVIRQRTISELRQLLDLYEPPKQGFPFRHYLSFNASGLERISDQITAFCNGLDFKR